MLRTIAKLSDTIGEILKGDIMVTIEADSIVLRFKIVFATQFWMYEKPLREYKP